MPTQLSDFRGAGRRPLLGGRSPPTKGTVCRSARGLSQATLEPYFLATSLILLRPPVIHSYLIVCTSLTLALLSGCGTGSQPGADATGTSTTAVTRISNDVDLIVAEVRASPEGPTTASTIVLHAVFENAGTGFTPFGYEHGTLSYQPIRYRIERDGQFAASGEIMGMTGRDRVERDITLAQQPPGDKHYQVIIDWSESVPERDEDNNGAEVIVLYGGNG
jgi:hypothetical protein